MSYQFALEGRLETSLRDIKERLGGLPNLKMTSRGTILRYQLFDSGMGETPGAVLEISASVLNVRFFVAELGPLPHAESMIKLLSLLAILDADYKVGLKALYEPVIASLHDFVLPKSAAMADRHTERLEAQVRALSAANTSIATELAERGARLDAAAAERDSYKGICSAVLAHIKGVSRDDEAMAKNLNAIGITEGMLSGLKAAAARNRGMSP